MIPCYFEAHLGHQGAANVHLLQKVLQLFRLTLVTGGGDERGSDQPEKIQHWEPGYRRHMFAMHRVVKQLMPQACKLTLL